MLNARAFTDFFARTLDWVNTNETTLWHCKAWRTFLQRYSSAKFSSASSSRLLFRSLLFRRDHQISACWITIFGRKLRGSFGSKNASSVTVRKRDATSSLFGFIRSSERGRVPILQRRSVIFRGVLSFCTRQKANCSMKAQKSSAAIFQAQAVLSFFLRRIHATLTLSGREEIWGRSCVYVLGQCVRAALWSANKKYKRNNFEERPSTLDARKGRPITLYAVYKKTIRKL